MGAQVNIAVSDAGPLIHLNEIGNLALLRVFETVHIPQGVWNETVGMLRVPEDALLQLRIVRRHVLLADQVSQFSEQNDLADLHDGERECLCLCRQLDASLLLTDDLAVRDRTKKLNLTPIGSLGIVVRAYRMRQIPLDEAQNCLNKLYDVSSLFVTRTIVELAIEELRKRA